MTTITPTCPLCDSPSRLEPRFPLADPAKDYWRCTECQWQHATTKPGLTGRPLDESEPVSLRRAPTYLPSTATA
jgi:hypothetical protein